MPHCKLSKSHNRNSTGVLYKEANGSISYTATLLVGRLSAYNVLP